MIIEKTFTIKFKIDTELAIEGYGANHNKEAYPNWDINYSDNPEEFIESTLAELQNSFGYSGLSAEVKEIN